MLHQLNPTDKLAQKIYRKNTFILAYQNLQ